MSPGLRDENGYRKLIAWQKSNLLAHKVYDLTNDFPKSEIFGLVSQMRRASLSVCANIAEGYSRKGIKDRRHFYEMAMGSLTELEFFIDFVFERQYIVKENYLTLLGYREETAKVLSGLIKST